MKSLLRRIRIWMLLSDLKREHKALVKSFQKTLNPKAAIAICTCMPGERVGAAHSPACRTLL